MREYLPNSLLTAELGRALGGVMGLFGWHSKHDRRWASSLGARNIDGGPIPMPSFKPSGHAAQYVALDPDSPLAEYFAANPAPVGVAELNKVPYVRLLATHDRSPIDALAGDLVLPLTTGRGLIGLALVRKSRWSKMPGADTLIGSARRMADLLELTGEAGEESSNEEGGRLNSFGQVAPIGKVAAHIHQLNNCLSLILAQARLLERDGLGREQLSQSVAAIEELTAKAAAAARMLADPSREASAPISRELLLDEVVSQAMDLASGRFRAAQRGPLDSGGLTVDMARGIRVRGDPEELHEALTNLLINAIDAVPSKGGRVHVRLSVQGRWACVHVDDNGSGIAREIEERVFDPFFTTKAGSGLGLGLGLAVARDIAARHGGWLRFESRSEGGTRFTLGLPLCQGEE